MTLGWAILGPGRFASSRVAPALNRAHGCRAIAVIGRDCSKAEQFAAEFGIPRVYCDLSEALSDKAVEAVWVATPHSLHHDAVLTIARAGRHVLCEKPLSNDPAAAREMVRACRQAGVILGTGFHLRHHPLHVEIRRIVQSGRAGRIISVDAEWSLGSRAEAESAEWRWDPSIAGGGIFTATGVHALDLVKFVLGDDIESVSATTDGEASATAVERGLVATLRFKHGTIATIRCHRGPLAPANDLRLDGERASLRSRHSLDEQARGVLEVEGLSGRINGVPVGTDLYALQAEAFAESVAAGRDPSASGADGLWAAEVTAAIYRSAESGSVVRLDLS